MAVSTAVAGHGAVGVQTDRPVEVRQRGGVVFAVNVFPAALDEFIGPRGLLRKRRIQESVLDELTGLGEKRKRTLLQRFGSIQRLRQATVEEIAAVPGIGPKMAATLKEFLAKS